MRILNTYYAFALAGIFAACNPTDASHRPDKPDNLISEKKMTSMLLDVHLIEGARSGVRVLGDSANVDVYYQGLFKKYDVTQGQFDTSFQYYSHYPRKMMAMYDVVIDSFNLMEMKIAEEEKRQQR
ncbi:MAG: DUF4296 domain-containing protein [Bacteroidetes bacterium]|uniref:DUF4296 domain-containing protein n=1 Tax=Phaeocystidibacter marisrubri TaxID=1577780 RepID=A0A6L3ZFL9_9FLAO|nr:DUF4296 domain-containing protein [Phaeocystidibacter marisrubri]KAB2816207.1 DUF4296 domain-containing protein [Phaeocystidibacter marisrubri]TNE30285.1 MAG: DUF4296 domain-containing protein [Bacteroidota bacterium]GGH67859.1 hypothetical protein GCM10011318_07290 [Phaeocystidibacter marisrubri]